MARPVFYPGDDSLVTGPTGLPFAGSPVRVYTAQTGGSQITDLLYVDSSGSLGAAVPSGILRSDGDGYLPGFAGPDGGPTTVWADMGFRGRRVAISADPTGGGGSGGGVTGTGGGAVTTTAAIAADAALAEAYGPGSDSWLKTNAAAFSFAFTGTPTYDSTTGLPTAATVRWPDGTTGTFTATIDGAANGYSGYAVSWAGTTTRTVTATGITYDASGNAAGPTGLAVS
jgi:hypothetical protein